MVVICLQPFGWAFSSQNLSPDSGFFSLVSDLAPLSRSNVPEASSWILDYIIVFLILGLPSSVCIDLTLFLMKDIISPSEWVGT